METIIIAVVALIVLVVVIVIFSGKSNTFGQESSACTTQGGKCIEAGQPCAAPAGHLSCGEETKTCGLVK